MITHTVGAENVVGVAGLEHDDRVRHAVRSIKHQLQQLQVDLSVVDVPHGGIGKIDPFVVDYGCCDGVEIRWPFDRAATDRGDRLERPPPGCRSSEADLHRSRLDPLGDAAPLASELLAYHHDD